MATKQPYNKKQQDIKVAAPPAANYYQGHPVDPDNTNNHYSLLPLKRARAIKERTIQQAIEPRHPANIRKTRLKQRDECLITAFTTENQTDREAEIIALSGSDTSKDYPFSKIIRAAQGPSISAIASYLIETLNIVEEHPITTTLVAVFTLALLSLLIFTVYLLHY